MLQRQLEPPRPEEGATIVETRELEVPKLVPAEAPLPRSHRTGQICCCLVPGCCVGPIVTVELGDDENLDDASRRIWKRFEAGDMAYLQRYQEMARAGLIELE